MRGSDQRSGTLFSYVDLEARVRPDHPLRTIRQLTDVALAARSGDFCALYAARMIDKSGGGADRQAEDAQAQDVRPRGLRAVTPARPNRDLIWRSVPHEMRRNQISAPSTPRRAPYGKAHRRHCRRACLYAGCAWMAAKAPVAIFRWIQAVGEIGTAAGPDCPLALEVT